MTQPVRFVTAEESLAESLRAAMNAIGNEGRYLGFIDAPPIETVRKHIQHATETESILRLVLAADGSVVGWCSIARSARASLRHSGYLGMALLPEYRGQGIGRRLAQETIEAAHAAGMSRIELEVFTTNCRAVAFYHALGFTDEGTKRRAWKLRDEYLDAHFMALILESE
jgi:RimJ/RimL family protein N-acetyltransferase